jgi:TM2 domain-containing membrane protein YozV
MSTSPPATPKKPIDLRALPNPTGPAPATPATPAAPQVKGAYGHTKLDPEPSIPCPDPPKQRPENGVKYEDFKVHYSDICTYINPDRDFETARTLSTFGGLLALDHFYLRSPTTAFAKIFVNCITFGLWWIWDMNQFWFEKEHVLNYGLSYLLDYERGIARGTMTTQKPEFVPKKDFMSFMMLAIFFGVFGLDRMYLGGDFVWQGWAKFLSCFILIGFIWVFYDMFKILFQPGSVLEDGYPVPLPFNTMNPDWDKVKSRYIGDLFQVTMDPQQKSMLEEAAAEAAKADGGSNPLAAAAAAASSKLKDKLGGKLGGLGALAGKIPGPLGMAAKIALPSQRGGSMEEDFGQATRAAFIAVLLGVGSLVGYSVIKAAKT